MNRVRDYRTLFVNSLIELAVGLVAVAICYQWVDRPVAFFMHDRQVEKILVFKWLTFPPPIVQTWSPLILALAMIRRAWGPLAHWQWTILVACLSLIVADQFRTSLGEMGGRYWPETWFDNNPSLIGNGVYGFHPFQAGDDRGSFPSGHAARILGFAGVWWIAMPRGRVLYALVCLPMLASLVAMNYHFVSDVIAGSVVGAIVARYASRLANLDAARDDTGNQVIVRDA